MTIQNNEIDPKALGTKFRLAREALKFSLDEVNQQVRIHTNSLANIERGEFNDWPGGSIYGKSFVRKYADFLKMNTSQIMSEFDQVGVKERRVDLRIGNEKSKHQGAGVKATWVMMRRYRKLALNILLVVIVIMVSLGVLLGVVKAFKFIGSVIHDKRIEMAARPKPVKVAKKTAPAIVKNKPKAKVETKVKAVVEPIPKIVKTTTPNTKPQSVAADTEETIPSAYLNSHELGNFPKIRKQDPLILEVRATVDVWMKLTADGKVLFEEILKKGASERWIADKDLLVKFGRPEGVLLTLNGYSLGKPGDGQAKHIRLTRSGLANAQ
ncbi:MAG: cytoskeletal protein RodZ [Candidatus Omnitrophota bacterium]|jgi:cytoskeletal protein RodZ